MRQLLLASFFSSAALFSFITPRAQLLSPKYEAGAGLSAFVYQGDLSPGALGSYRTVRPGLSLSGSRLLNSYFALRVALAGGGLRGDDKKFNMPEWRTQRNFSFSSFLGEASIQMVYNIRGTNGDNEYRVLSPYLFTGIGFSFLRTSRDYSQYNSAYFGAESWVTSGLAEDAARRPARRLLVLPVGAGVRYPISPHLSIAVETNFRVAFSDYIDGFSRSANRSKKDYYYSHSAGLIYTFNSNNGIKCPKIIP